MAIGIHIATYRAFDISDYTGEPTTDPIDAGVTRFAVLPDVDIDNTDGYPTIAEYLALEAADDYCCNHIADGLIVTYSVADMNAL